METEIPLQTLNTDNPFYNAIFHSYAHKGIYIWKLLESVLERCLIQK